MNPNVCKYTIRIIKTKLERGKFFGFYNLKPPCI